MACYHPISAFRSLVKKTPNGKSVIAFKADPIKTQPYEKIQLPCGQCIGCKISRSRQWALRCVHEASLYQNNCFITLTYNDENLPKNRSLNKRHLTLFFKSLRFHHQGIEPVKDEQTGTKRFPIRYFACGEYGAKLSRPHFHACIFNFNFPDRVRWTEREGITLYTSQQLQALWPYGYSTIGDVTWQSAAYVARYVTKKINGDRAAEHYIMGDPETGEAYYLEPEYITMSRRPGIAKRWFMQYKTDCFPKDYLTHEGKRLKIPSYYDRIYDQIEPEKLSAIRQERRKKACNNQHNTRERLKVREDIQLKRSKKLIREYENDPKNVFSL